MVNFSLTQNYPHVDPALLRALETAIVDDEIVIQLLQYVFYPPREVPPTNVNIYFDNITVNKIDIRSMPP